jgi:hypothetical protein
MRATFLGKDPESIEGESPTLFATDRPNGSCRAAIGQGSVPVAAGG